jgi:hypothetical protein
VRVTPAGVAEVARAAAVVAAAAAAHDSLCSRSYWIVTRRGYPSRARVLRWVDLLPEEVNHRLMPTHKEHPIVDRKHAIYATKNELEKKVMSCCYKRTVLQPPAKRPCIYEHLPFP